MMSLDTPEQKDFSESDLNKARDAYKNLENQFGYSFENAQASIKFMIVQNRNKTQSWMIYSLSNPSIRADLAKATEFPVGVSICST